MVSTTPGDIDSLTIGQRASCTFVVGEAEIEAMAQLTGDVNPLHLDDATARQCGFPGRIAHGLISLGAVSRLIGTRLPGPGSLWIQQNVQFVEPVHPGDRLEARVTVQQVSPGTRVVTLLTEVVKLDTQAVVLRGEAKVRLPPTVTDRDR
jgi:3-hydroxybutyryl-CoA dehydratase